MTRLESCLSDTISDTVQFFVDFQTFLPNKPPERALKRLYGRDMGVLFTLYWCKLARQMTEGDGPAVFRTLQAMAMDPGLDGRKALKPEPKDVAEVLVLSFLGVWAHVMLYVASGTIQGIVFPQKGDKLHAKTTTT